MIDASRAICIIVIRIHAEKQAYCSDNDLLERSKMRICQWPVVKQDQIGKMTAVYCLEEKKKKTQKEDSKIKAEKILCLCLPHYAPRPLRPNSFQEGASRDATNE